MEDNYKYSSELLLILRNAWVKSYGGSGAEYFSVLQPTNDGGFIVLGYT